MTYKRFRLVRRVAIFMAALPLLQFGPCATGANQVLGNTINLLPAIATQSLQSTMLYPVQILLALLTGGTGSNVGGGGGSGSGSGTGGIGGGGFGGGSGI